MQRILAAALIAAAFAAFRIRTHDAASREPSSVADPSLRDAVAAGPATTNCSDDHNDPSFYAQDCLIQDWRDKMQVARKIGAGPGAAAPDASGPPGAPIGVPKAVDLTRLVPGAEKDPNKGPIGACHAFASVALLNAAYLRQYGESEEFSPADLLLQATSMLNPEREQVRLLNPDRETPGQPLAYAPIPEIDYYYWEGGYESMDLNIAVSRGLAKAEHVPYNDFVPWYTHNLRPVTTDDMIALDRSGVLTRFLNLAQTPSQRRRLQEGIRKQSAREIDENRRRYEKFLGGSAPYVDEDRRESRARFQGFKVVKIVAARPPELAAPDAAFCRLAGMSRAQGIISELDHRRPVLATIMNGEHGILIDGYARDANGRVSFKTLNSWGPGSSLPIPDEQMCHVTEAITLIVPRDSDAPSPVDDSPF